jgi:hypothetical protein
LTYEVITNLFEVLLVNFRYSIKYLSRNYFMVATIM